MRIGIDARMFAPDVGGGGLGRYVEQLVCELQKQDHENRYVLFLKRENFDRCQIENPLFEKRLADVHWYTVSEQLQMPKLMKDARVDLMHFPHWNVPILSKTPFMVTIHDLILLDEPTSAHVTTRHKLIFFAKRLGYRLVLKHAIERSQKIIAVSHATKDSILRHFPNIAPEKIQVIYEGVSLLPNQPTSYKLQATNYLLYIGNAYPHKNLNLLLAAFTILSRQHPDLHLVLAGRADVFYERLKKTAEELGAPMNRLHFIQNPSDSELSNLYRHARLFVFPSRREGFGLPPLEAMSLSLPVAAARTSSLPEILGDAAIYFSPDNVEEMARVIERGLTDETLRQTLVARGLEQIKRYSWEKMAKEIQAVYGGKA